MTTTPDLAPKTIVPSSWLVKVQIHLNAFYLSDLFRLDHLAHCDVMLSNTFCPSRVFCVNTCVQAMAEVFNVRSTSLEPWWAVKDFAWSHNLKMSATYGVFVVIKFVLTALVSCSPLMT